MIVVIDNYDSFVHNLARHIRLCGQNTSIIRNDAQTPADIKALNPLGIVISPGPCTPNEAGESLNIIRELGADIPILGVCLGHQCIGTVYGANVDRAPYPLHGQQSHVTHNASALFKDIPSPFMVGRYHSLHVNVPQTSALEVTAKTDDNIVMAFQHQKNPVYGVQFHPESLLTTHGLTLLKNFITLAKDHHHARMA